MRTFIIAAVTAVLMLLAGPASAALVNVNTNNTVHPNNNLRCSGQCDILSDNDVDVLP